MTDKAHTERYTSPGQASVKANGRRYVLECPVVTEVSDGAIVEMSDPRSGKRGLYKLDLIDWRGE